MTAGDAFGWEGRSAVSPPPSARPAPAPGAATRALRPGPAHPACPWCSGTGRSRRRRSVSGPAPDRCARAPGTARPAARPGATAARPASPRMARRRRPARDSARPAARCRGRSRRRRRSRRPPGCPEIGPGSGACSPGIWWRAGRRRTPRSRRRRGRSCVPLMGFDLRGGRVVPDMPDNDGRHPGETAGERSDRNFDDLLQEVRVAQTGVQILFAFLLTLPFSARFGATSELDRVVYVITLLASAAAGAFLIAPVSYHRLLFRMGKKEELVRNASRMAICGVACILIAIVGAVFLVLDVVYGMALAVTAAAGLLVLAATLWFALPLRHRLGPHAAISNRPRPPTAVAGGAAGSRGRCGSRSRTWIIRYAPRCSSVTEASVCACTTVLQISSETIRHATSTLPSSPHAWQVSAMNVRACPGESSTGGNMDSARGSDEKISADAGAGSRSWLGDIPGQYPGARSPNGGW